MTRLAVALCYLFVAATYSACLNAQQDGSIRTGMWSGGYGALDNQSEWYTLIADLEVTGRTIKGSLRRGGQIEGEISDGTVHLSIAQDRRRLRCAARLDSGALAGTCSGGSRPFILQLVYEPTIPTETLEAMAGLYEDEHGNRILIEKSIHLIYHDFKTGAYRVLYADDLDRFVAGERLGVPRPTDLRIRFVRNDNEIVHGIEVQDAAGTVRRANRCCPYRVEEFTFTNDGVTLAGSLYLPPGPGPHPGAVYVHGSGPQTRAGAGLWPIFLVAKGFAVLAYDKRGQGKSGGSYRLSNGSRDNRPHMQRRSTDVRSGFEALKQRDDIDVNQVGLIGGSQAGWVMPMVAEHGGIAFTITLSGGATELSIEGRFSNWANESGSGGPSIDEVISRLRTYVPRDYDFRPHFARQKAPGLWLYGGMDRSNPSILSIELLEEVRARTGNDFTIQFFPSGNHGLMDAQAGGAAESLALGSSVPGLYQIIGNWLEEKGFGPRPGADGV